MNNIINEHMKNHSIINYVKQKHFLFLMTNVKMIEMQYNAFIKEKHHTCILLSESELILRNKMIVGTNFDLHCC